MRIGTMATVVTAALVVACGGTEADERFGSGAGAVAPECAGEIPWEGCEDFDDDFDDGDFDDVAPEEPGEAPPPRRDVPKTCIKIEGSSIGRSGISLDVGVSTVAIDGWIGKTDSRGDYIGFHWTVAGADMDVVVKAGTGLHDAVLEVGSGTWEHPAGRSGPRAKGISYVKFCGPVEHPEPGDDEPGDGDGELPGGGDDGSGGSGGGSGPGPILM